jgi:hypothetical protein
MGFWVLMERAWLTMPTRRTGRHWSNYGLQEALKREDNHYLMAFQSSGRHSLALQWGERRNRSTSTSRHLRKLLKLRAAGWPSACRQPSFTQIGLILDSDYPPSQCVSVLGNFHGKVGWGLSGGCQSYWLVFLSGNSRERLSRII